MSQRMFSFDIDEKRGVVGPRVHLRRAGALARGGRTTRRCSPAVMTTDVVPGGCELDLEAHRRGVFTASTDPKRCHAAGGAKAAQGRLTADTLTLGGFEFRKLAH